jgi:hypothetical protein
MVEGVLEPNDPYAYLFGFTVALRRDSVIVGAPWTRGTADGSATADINFHQSSGSAYIFHRDVSGAWAEDPCRLKASNADTCDNFGIGLAATDDYVVVGAPLEDSSSSGFGGDGASNDLLDTGAAYVYTTP